MLAVIRHSWPSMHDRVLDRVAMRDAIAVDSSMSCSPSHTTTNSSPPMRATVSDLRCSRSSRSRHLHQHTVGELVAVAVVDELEVVEVAEQHGDEVVRSFGAVTAPPPAAPVKRHAVGDAGQRVAEAAFEQLRRSRLCGLRRRARW